MMRNKCHHPVRKALLILKLSPGEDFMPQYLQSCYPFIGACHLEIHISIVILNSLPAQTENQAGVIPNIPKVQRNESLLRLPGFPQLLFCCSGLTLFLSPLDYSSFSPMRKDNINWKEKAYECLNNQQHKKEQTTGFSYKLVKIREEFGRQNRKDAAHFSRSDVPVLCG